MKVERINEIQIKFVLTKTDLEKRSLDISDLAYGSSKTQELFQDIIETASREFSFNLDDTPLMIEAVPMSKSSITIMLTKASPQAKNLPSLASSLLKKMENVPKQNSADDEDTMIKIPKKKESARKEKVCKNTTGKMCLVYSFDSLDSISQSARLVKNAKIDSSIYKFKNDYMVICNFDKTKNDNSKLVNRIFSEHGKKMPGKGELVKAYLYENGEKIIAKNAMEIMANL